MFKTIHLYLQCSHNVRTGKRNKIGKIHVICVLHRKMLNDNRVGCRMDSLNMVMKRINKKISIK